MGQLTDLKQIRKIRNRKKNAKRFAILMVLAVIIASLFLILEKIKEFDIKTKIDDTIISMGNGPGFPIDIAGREAISLFEVSKLPAIVNDSNIFVYNPKGKATTNIQHGYNRPIAYASNGRIVIFDLGGTKLKLHSLSKLLCEKKFDNPIINADISESGTFYVATESNNYVGEVVAFNKKGDQIFKWSSSKNVVTNASLSPDGNYLAVTAVNSNDGGLISFLYIFKISTGTEISMLTFDDELPIDLSFKSSTQIVLLTDKSIKTITNLGRRVGEYSFNDEAVYDFDIENCENSTIVLGVHNQTGELNVVNLDIKNNVIGTFKTDKKISSIKIDDENLRLTANDEILFYDFNGLELQKIDAPLVRKSLMIDNNLYYTTHNQVYKLNI
ncbi:MAG: DUF5711 family protein, partial [Oscillospiraceae bacterium]